MLHLVLGGARSGKSSFAEQWLLACFHAQVDCSTAPIYVATAQGLDDEMKARIQHHQRQRDSKPWQLIECPLELTALLSDFNENRFADHGYTQSKQACLQSGPYLLIDCLTLWLTNQLMAFHAVSDDSAFEKKLSADQYLHACVDELIVALTKSEATIVVVSNEIGLGVVPMGKETRLFVDHAGWMNQKLAQVAQQVTLVTAGLPLTLKGVNSVKSEGTQHG